MFVAGKVRPPLKNGCVCMDDAQEMKFTTSDSEKVASLENMRGKAFHMLPFMLIESRFPHLIM